MSPLLKLAILKQLEVSDDLLLKATLHSEEGRSARYTFRHLPTMQPGAEEASAKHIPCDRRLS